MPTDAHPQEKPSLVTFPDAASKNPLRLGLSTFEDSVPPRGDIAARLRADNQSQQSFRHDIPSVAKRLKA